MPMIQSLLFLLLCQLAGEALSRAFALPVSGPVLGLVLLAALLLARRRPVPVALRNTTHGILGSLSLLFVPAGVGIVGEARALAENGLALAIAVLVSTALTLLVTVGVFRLVSRLVLSPPPGPDHGEGSAR